MHVCRAAISHNSTLNSRRGRSTLLGNCAPTIAMTRIAMTSRGDDRFARRANVPHAVGLNPTPNQWLHFTVLLPQGAYRDRHGRWKRDAMDAIGHEMNDAIADGEVVWSWRTDAGAKLAKTLTRLAGDDGKRARSPAVHRGDHV
jgi:hypothetical protein